MPVAGLSIPGMIEVTASVNWDLSVAEMIWGPDFTNYPNITSGLFPNCHSGKTGVEEDVKFVAVCLAHLFSWREIARYGGYVPTVVVRRRLEERGYVPAELPELAALKDQCDWFWGQHVWFVGALGSNSICTEVDGKERGPALHFSPRGRRYARGFRVSEPTWCWRAWFLCRKIPSS